jgi:ribosomal protein S18 acetylase RimI-like enzyme
MLIKELKKASEEVIKEIRQLEDICKKHDKLTGNIFLDSTLNFNPDIKSLFLLYEDSKLISLLLMFIPTQNEAEISGFTLPEYRQKGYFKTLLARVNNELKKYEVLDILFVCEPQSLDGKAVIKKLEAKYDFTEYSLKYNQLNATSLNQYLNKIELYKPNLQDYEILIDLSQQIFDDSYEDAESMIIKAFESQSRQQYLAILDRESIGMGGVSFEQDGAYIFGFGIIPKYQGKGFGKAMLKLILKDLIEQNVEKILIEVNSENERAFNLYKKYGFEVQTAFEYFRKKLIFNESL